MHPGPSDKVQWIRFLTIEVVRDRKPVGWQPAVPDPRVEKGPNFEVVSLVPCTERLKDKDLQHSSHPCTKMQVAKCPDDATQNL